MDPQNYGFSNRTIGQARKRGSLSLRGVASGHKILDVRRPEIVRPAIGADRGRVAAAVARVIDQHAPNALVAHLGECDLGRAGRGGVGYAQ
jgi:hypothetical protein